MNRRDLLKAAIAAPLAGCSSATRDGGRDSIPIDAEISKYQDCTTGEWVTIATWTENGECYLVRLA